ncbi:MAG TPA: ATP synthase F1 subunit delta [Puia sp.]|jgi:F-type H+-transporting ATPase subunit delta|nr:ATP synthase F1 subunit delta [Puia sp.]
MAPNPRLAARYAKSILDLAVERGQLDTVYKDMVFLKEICRSSRDLVNLLRSPIVKSDRKRQILETITADRISPLTTAFNALLMNKEREAWLPEIAAAFVEQYKEYKGIQTVKLTTAVPVSDEIKQTILDKVKTDRQVAAIDLETSVREELIGGFVLEIGDELIDASIAYDLNKVKQQFQNNDFIYKIR